MTAREVIHTVLAGKRPPYVPWAFGFTREAHEKVLAHYGAKRLEEVLCEPLLWVGNMVGFMTDLPGHHVRDYFGAEWDRSVDQDIGVVVNRCLPEPTLQGYAFPDPLSPQLFADIPEKFAQYPDRYRVFNIGFSLYERAWTLRGMENLMCDFVENPGFVHELLTTITDYNLTQINKALTYDIDAVYFGDDWGQQHGLQMGYPTWKAFIYPCLQRMYGAARAAGQRVFIHSCGDVDELFPDLIAAGVNCFNPFQPEVLDVFALLQEYRGRLSFHGGLSTQRTLPYGTVSEVRAETRRLLEAGREGGYILAPAHAVEGDVPVENIVAALEEAIRQPGSPVR